MGATHPTSLRIPAAAKRRIAAAARRRGVSTQKFILEAALREATAATPDDVRLSRLAAIVEQVREVVEDELDVRVGDAAWERHLATGSRLHSSAEIKRELGL